MTFLRSTAEETCGEHHSRRQSRLIALGLFATDTPPDRLRITRRRTWWLWRIPVWRWTVAVIEMPIRAHGPKAALPSRTHLPDRLRAGFVRLIATEYRIPERYLRGEGELSQEDACTFEKWVAGVPDQLSHAAHQQGCACLRCREKVM